MPVQRTGGEVARIVCREFSPPPGADRERSAAKRAVVRSDGSEPEMTNEDIMIRGPPDSSA